MADHSPQDYDAEEIAAATRNNPDEYPDWLEASRSVDNNESEAGELGRYNSEAGMEVLRESARRVRERELSGDDEAADEVGGEGEQEPNIFVDDEDEVRGLPSPIAMVFERPGDVIVEDLVNLDDPESELDEIHDKLAPDLDATEIDRQLDAKAFDTFWDRIRDPETFKYAASLLGGKERRVRSEVQLAQARLIMAEVIGDNFILTDEQFLAAVDTGAGGGGRKTEIQRWVKLQLPDGYPALVREWKRRVEHIREICQEKYEQMEDGETRCEVLADVDDWARQVEAIEHFYELVKTTDTSPDHSLTDEVVRNLRILLTLHKFKATEMDPKVEQWLNTYAQNPAQQIRREGDYFVVNADVDNMVPLALLMEAVDMREAVTKHFESETTSASDESEDGEIDGPDRDELIDEIMEALPAFGSPEYDRAVAILEDVVATGGSEQINQVDGIAAFVRSLKRAINKLDIVAVRRARSQGNPGFALSNNDLEIKHFAEEVLDRMEAGDEDKTDHEQKDEEEPVDETDYKGLASEIAEVIPDEDEDAEARSLAALALTVLANIQVGRLHPLPVYESLENFNEAIKTAIGELFEGNEDEVEVKDDDIKVYSEAAKAKIVRLAEATKQAMEGGSDDEEGGDDFTQAADGENTMSEGENRGLLNELIDRVTTTTFEAYDALMPAEREGAIDFLQGLANIKPGTPVDIQTGSSYESERFVTVVDGALRELISLYDVDASRSRDFFGGNFTVTLRTEDENGVIRRYGHDTLDFINKVGTAGYVPVRPVPGERAS